MNKTQMKKLAFGLVMLGIGLLGVRRAEAVGTNPDTMVVSVTPGNPQYGVYISSPDAGTSYGYNFGSVNMGATTGSTKAIVVKSSGTVSEYFAMSVVGSGSNPWTALAVDGPTGNDTFELLGHFGTNQTPDGSFSTTNDIITGSVPGSVGTTIYNQGTRTAPAATQNLWLKLFMPSGVSSANTQNLILTINGQAN